MTPPSMDFSQFHDPRPFPEVEVEKLTGEEALREMISKLVGTHALTVNLDYKTIFPRVTVMFNVDDRTMDVLRETVDKP